MTRSDRWFLLGVFFVALIVGINVPVRAQTVPPFLIFGSPGSTSTPQVIKSTSNALWVSIVSLSSQLLFANGTAALPGLSPVGDGDTGFFWTSSGQINLSSNATPKIRLGTRIDLASNGVYTFEDNTDVTAGNVDTGFSRTAAATVVLGNGTASDFAGTFKTTTLQLAGKPSLLNGITTAGMGAPIIVAQARTVAAVNTGTASVATYTVGAADGTFEVGCNVLITTSTTHSFSCDTTYTDEGNTARTMVLPMAALAGTFVTTGLMTNVTGAGPYESSVMTIRAKAATAITIRTSAGGTFTTVTYNIDGTIKQVG